MSANDQDNFNRDPYPGKPKILFISRASSSHTVDWINLLAGSEFNVRLFAQPHTLPPADWPFRTYVTGFGASKSVQVSNTRQRLYVERSMPVRAALKLGRELGVPAAQIPSAEDWLIDIIKAWQPDIIQTLSMTSSQFFWDACQQTGYTFPGVWMLMIWGAPDILLQQHHPADGPRLRDLITHADYVFSDTEECMDAARGLGLQDTQIPAYYVFPGAGGVDVDSLAAGWRGSNPPSQRRVILWPKSYNNYYTSALTTLEAIKLAWDQIQPCKLIIPNIKDEAEQWFHTLPDEIKAKTRLPAHMPHAEFQQMMTEARVMLAPSLLDGLPNVLVDALACGAFPIMSPLGGLTPILKDEENTLFARNLYPQDIADALIRAMNDDDLVDAAAERNISVAKRIADRETIQAQVLQIYTDALQRHR